MTKFSKLHGDAPQGNGFDLGGHSCLLPSQEYLAFESNLKIFANQVECITALQTGGKLLPDIAYEKITNLWEQLTESGKKYKPDIDWDFD